MTARGKCVDLGGEKSPCMDCQDRELHCHNDCKRYREFRQKRQECLAAKGTYYLQQAWTAKKRATYNKWAKVRDDWWKK